VIDGLTLPHCAKGTAAVLDRLNVRADPHTDALVVGLLLPSEVITVWAVLNGWAIVQRVDGLAGWASMAYLKPVGELAP